jgi:hypothetical protein
VTNPFRDLATVPDEAGNYLPRSHQVHLQAGSQQVMQEQPGISLHALLSVRSVVPDQEYTRAHE